jgi:hypothetical protein
LAAGGGTVTANANGTLGGTGTINRAVTINGTVAPGDGGTGTGTGTGTLTVGNTAWNTNGTYRFEINNATGTAGSSSSGWDLLTGVSSGTTLTVNATNTNKFTVRLVSLDAAQTPGNAQNFVNTDSYTWKIAQFDGGISGFALDKFTLDTTEFSNSLGGGAFSLSADTNAIYVVFTPIPEPTAVFGIAAAGLGLVRLVRRRRAAV